jgi:DNA-binding CsgD family transcriptional regulator/PAS domain-containing protein
MKEPLTTAQLSHLVGLIYDAAIDPGRWPTALEAIRVTLGFANTALGLNTFPTGKAHLGVTTNIPPEYDSTLADYGPEVIEIWGGLETLQNHPMDQPALLSRINPAALDFEVTTNRMALEWAKPQGLIDNIALPLAMDERGYGSLAMGRHRDQGPVGEMELEAARLLIPHLQRAVAINRLFDLELLARTSFERTLEKLATPVLLTTAEMRLVHANPAARKILDDGDLLRMQNGVLTAVNGVLQALSVAVAQAGRDEAAIGRKGIGIPAHRRDGTVAALHVLPLHPDRLPASNPAVAAIFVAEADKPRAVSTDLIASLFGLTAAEARVFEQIAAGRSVAETAAALAVEPSTVRTQILHIFDKTGVRRQADLIRLSAALGAPIDY